MEDCAESVGVGFGVCWREGNFVIVGSDEGGGGIRGGRRRRREGGKGGEVGTHDGGLPVGDGLIGRGRPLEAEALAEGVSDPEVKRGRLLELVHALPHLALHLLHAAPLLL